MNNIKFSKKLRSKMQIPGKIPYSYGNRSLLQIGENPLEWYTSYMFTMHSIIRSSVPLMRSAYNESLRYDDHISQDLSKYYAKHVIEEMNHDKWIIEDLNLIGVNSKIFNSIMPSVKVAELVGSQYYWIYHWHPLCLLGYIAVLEGHPPTKEYIDNLEHATDFPRDAFRTISKHSVLDLDHKQDLDDLLDALPLTNDQQEWISLNAFHTLSKLEDIFLEPHKILKTTE